MRIATWNVNSLKARQDRVEEWLAQRQPDILLMQETKLADETAPVMAFRMAGYELLHHGEGRWNGVAIASRTPAEDVSFGFEGTGPDAEGARFVAGRIDGIRAISVYAPNGRALGTPFYDAKLDWYRRLLAWLEANADPNEPLVLGGDLNVAPTDMDVYDPQAYIGTTHTSPPEREAFQSLLDWGLVEAYRRFHPEAGKFTWWDYRAGNFHKGLGMRIDHLLVTKPLADRLAGAEIDRDARKGKLPSDHAPMWIDVQ
ncbi:MAG: exodeoxyribonuclease [Thermoleophilaceae bacterium]|jgi:exodeoxyribonuclease-3|nr:exodeoxyribonuclease [Thermoleophilaceae bacterium]MEA2622975.1 exodeoxyribonuclease [Chloroflexota bacterium]